MSNSKHGKLINFLLKFHTFEEGSYREDIKRMINKNRERNQTGRHKVCPLVKAVKTVKALEGASPNNVMIISRI